MIIRKIGKYFKYLENAGHGLVYVYYTNLKTALFLITTKEKTMGISQVQKNQLLDLLKSHYSSFDGSLGT